MSQYFVTLKVRFDADWDQWIVEHSDGEAKSYYCDDRDDALATRDAMRDFELNNGREVNYVGHCGVRRVR